MAIEGFKASELTPITAAEVSEGSLFYIGLKDGDNFLPRAMTPEQAKIFFTTNPTVVPSSEPAKYLRVRRTSNLSIPNNVFTTVAWQEQDDHSDGLLSWALGDNGKIIIGPGVTKVEITTNIEWDFHADGSRWARHDLDNNTFPGHGYEAVRAGLTANRQNIKSATIEVEENQAITTRIAHNRGAALNLMAGDATWMEVKVVEAMVS